MARGGNRNPTGKGGQPKGGPSRNPRGRPKKDFEAQALVAAATNGGADIIATINEIRRLEAEVDAKGNLIADPTAQVRLAAAKALADRLWGTPPQHGSLTIGGGKKDSGAEAPEELVIRLNLGD